VDIFLAFEHSPIFFAVSVLLLGLCVGSFLNVVIHRLPKMLDREWKSQCLEYLGQQHGEANSGSGGNETGKATEGRYNLVVPRSACPSCGHKITALENVPLLSYMVLRGRCSACQAKISIRYPIVEALTGAVSAFVAWHFGFSLATALALVFCWALIALTFIDADTQLLPDDITLPLLWLGLLVNVGGMFTDLRSAVLGVVVGYLVLWLVYWGFRLLTGKEGMGYGDFKLLAALGAWLGWQMMPLVVLVSAAVGAVVGLVGILAAGQGKGARIPFGPYLAAAGFIGLIWGHGIVEWYLGSFPR
jgi:leader peptidase (prepilin peptidase) / N-methyltransferase